MKKIRILIALLFALIFVFPSIYQAVHVVKHHWQTHNELHSCLLHQKHNDSIGFNRPTETPKVCLICEFEFASFQKAAKIDIGGIAYIYIDLVRKEIQESVYCTNHRLIKLRGPPIYS